MKRARTIIVVIVALIFTCILSVILLTRQPLSLLQQSDLSRLQVYAYRDWQSLGVQVESGDMVSLRAQGEWLYTPGEYHGPEGHQSYRAPDTYPVNAVSGGVLLGRVGESGPIVVVGRGTTFVAQQSGFIYMRINDDMLSDNEGVVYIEISIKSAAELEY